MKVFTEKADLLAWLSSRRAPRVLVPTMGALHRGHTSLLDRAREEASALNGGEVVATIFVNPVQFGPNEDFVAYPRPLEDDLAKCREHEVDAVYAPEIESVYEADRSILVTESQLSGRLCGASRPGHFDGVCTIVTKLFNLIRPAAAVFGEKDFQQLAVIRRLVRDLDIPVGILAGATVREEDGLALSSRNAYLDEEERAQAPVLYRALEETARGIAAGRFESPSEAKAAFQRLLEEAPLARLDYFEIVETATLEPLEQWEGATPRLLSAAFYGKTRLIDNVGVSSFEQ